MLERYKRNAALQMAEKAEEPQAHTTQSAQQTNTHGRKSWIHRMARRVLINLLRIFALLIILKLLQLL